MIRVVLADDHAVLRGGLARLLADHSDIRVVGEAGSADDLFALLAATAADVLVLDVTMPGPGLGEVLRRIPAVQPRLRTLVLSMHPEEQYAVRALRAGAAGYVTKERSAQELVEAVRRVARGGRFVSHDLAERLAAELARAEPTSRLESLSDRELAVLQGLAAGQSVKAVAKRLSISPKTVSTYRARVMAKLGLTTTADLVRFAVEHGLAEARVDKEKL